MMHCRARRLSIFPSEASQLARWPPGCPPRLPSARSRIGQPRRAARAMPCKAQHSLLKSPKSPIKIEADTPFGALYKVLLPGPLAYTPALLMPASVVLAAYGSVYGPQWVDTLLAISGIKSGALAGLVHRVWSDSALLHLVVSTAFASLGALCDFVAVPALDVLLGRDLGEDNPEQVHKLESNAAFHGVLYTFAGLHFAALASSCYVAGHFNLHPLALTGLTASQAAAGGVMLTVVHELVHSRRRADHWLASALLCTVGYMHWGLAHLTHHLNVGKHSDPATARRGESLYEFIPRSICGHLADGVAAEQQRLRAKGISAWSPRNRIIWWAVCPLALAAAVRAACGPAGLTLLVGQAVGAVILLEAVNYIEHWGLERQQLRDGRWEKVHLGLSWNANWIATSAITFRLQRHAHHHLASSRPYQALQNIDEAPQLPASYPAMAILALFPGLFMDVMNSRLDAYLAAAAGSSSGGAAAADD